MGKVLSKFTNGWTGAVSRSIDDIIISMKNAADAAIPFGAPVFQASGENACVPFNSSTSTGTNFVGFAVRVPDKTPDTAVTAQNQANPLAVWRRYETMEVLVRGAVTVPMAVSANRGSEIYLRKADGKLVASPGATGSTIELTNVKLRNARDTVSGCAEVIVNKRNII